MTDCFVSVIGFGRWRRLRRWDVSPQETVGACCRQSANGEETDAFELVPPAVGRSSLDFYLPGHFGPLGRETYGCSPGYYFSVVTRAISLEIRKFVPIRCRTEQRRRDIISYYHWKVIGSVSFATPPPHSFPPRVPRSGAARSTDDFGGHARSRPRLVTSTGTRRFRWGFVDG